MVKKIFFVVAAVLVLLLLAVLIVPQFIDWNRYKDQIAAEASRMTGRAVTIGGDIRLSVLPSPALVVNDLRVANIENGVAPEMVRLAQAEVHVALLPLLSRRIVVNQITLVEPVVALEVLSDGRNNWTFTPAEPAPEERPLETPPQPESAPPDVRLDAVAIENGTITYHDVAAGTTRRLDALNATIQAESLQGPATSEGRFRIEGIPIVYSGEVGSFATDRQAPLTLTLASPEGDVRAVVRGSALDLEADARFRGRVEAEAGNLAAAIQALTRGPLPGFLAQRAALAFDLDASAQHASIDALALRLGETTADGAAAIEFGDEVSLAAQLAAGTIDLASWLAMPEVPPPPAVTGSTAEGADAAPAQNAAPDGDAVPPSFRLPADVSAALTLAVEAMTFNNDAIRQVRADAELADGRITLSRLSALLPGAAEAAMVGALTTPDGQPRFEGRLEARAADLRSVLRWLDVDVAMVPSDRLRTLQLNSAMVITPQQMEARDLDLRMDSSTIRGTAGARLTERPAFNIDLAVDRLNLDAYLPVEGPAPADSPPVAPGQGALPEAEAGPVPALDAAFAVRIADLTYKSVPARDAVLTGSFTDGTLTLTNAGVGDFAGATAGASGVVRGLPERPVMENLAVRFSAPEPARLLRSLEMDVPAQAQALGAISGEGTLNGTLQAPVVDLGIQAAGSTVRLAGAVNPQPGVLYDGRVALQASDPAPLLTALDLAYRPAGPIGPIDLSTAVSVRDAEISVRELSGRLAETPVSGSVTVATAGPKPQIAADLVTGRLNIDALLPAEQAAAAPGWLVPAAWGQSPRVVRPPARRAGIIETATQQVHPRWSREPIDLSALSALDGTFALRADALVYQGHALDKAELNATLAGGILTAEPVRGSFYGGPLTASARIEATGVPVVTMAINVDGADLARVPAAPQGTAGGRLVADARLTTQGGSMADWVSALRGKGSFAVRGLNPALDASGLPVLGPVLGPTLRLVGSLDSTLGPLLGIVSGRAGPGLADISAPFTIADGVVRLDPVRLDSAVYQATARGTTDLAGWRIDMAGEMTLAQGVVGTLLGRVQEIPSRCPFAATGPLDRPNIQIGGECLPRGITIPGTGGQDAGRTLEQLIPKEMLPGGEQQPPQPGSPSPAPQQAPQPEKVIRDLLEGLIRR